MSAEAKECMPHAGAQGKERLMECDYPQSSRGFCRGGGELGKNSPTQTRRDQRGGQKCLFSALDKSGPDMQRCVAAGKNGEKMFRNGIVQRQRIISS